MKASPRIALCGEKDLPALMRFINDAWARNHILSRDEALLRWQFDARLREDWDGDSPLSILVAWDGDRIVGMLGLTYVRWSQGGDTYLGAWTSHWFVIPELRTSHLSLLLIRQAMQLGLDLIGSLGVNDRAVSLLSNIGYDVIAEIPRWVAIVNAKGTADLLVGAGLEATRYDGALRIFTEREIAERAPNEDSEWLVTEWGAGDSVEWNTCWSRSVRVGFTGVIRDSAYLQWRYLRHPIFCYRVWVARHRSSSRIGGIAVSRVEAVRGRAERVLRVVEVLAGDPSATDRLLIHLVDEARAAGASFADFYCTKKIDGLREAGFRLERAGLEEFPIPLRFQPLEAGGRPLNAAIRAPAGMRGSLLELSNRGALYLTKADGDMDRPN